MPLYVGDLIGFTLLGDVKSQLDHLVNAEANSNPAIPPELLSNSIMTIMVKGLFINLEFPYAFFPGRKVTGYMLYNPLWEAVVRLEDIGFKVSQNKHV